MSAPADQEASRAACVDWVLGERGLPGGCDPRAVDEWLLARGLAAVAVAEPAGFEIPGPFLGRFGTGWAVEFGVTAGVIHDPGSVADGERLEAQVLVPLDLGSAPGRPNAHTLAGVVEAIAVTRSAEGSMLLLDRANAIAGVGLEGDRYAAGNGTFSPRGGSGRSLTLIEAEALEELAAKGIDLAPVDARRNLVVRGIDLDGLIGRRFRVGGVECAGCRRCEPCAVLERLTRPGVLRALVHRGGLRADVLGSGEIRTGDEIVALI